MPKRHVSKFKIPIQSGKKIKIEKGTNGKLMGDAKVYQESPKVEIYRKFRINVAGMHYNIFGNPYAGSQQQECENFVKSEFIAKPDKNGK